MSWESTSRSSVQQRPRFWRPRRHMHGPGRSAPSAPRCRSAVIFPHPTPPTRITVPDRRAPDNDDRMSVSSVPGPRTRVRRTNAYPARRPEQRRREVVVSAGDAVQRPRETDRHRVRRPARAGSPRTRSAPAPSPATASARPGAGPRAHTADRHRRPTGTSRRHARHRRRTGERGSLFKEVPAATEHAGAELGGPVVVRILRQRVSPATSQAPHAVPSHAAPSASRPRRWPHGATAGVDGAGRFRRERCSRAAR